MQQSIQRHLIRAIKWVFIGSVFLFRPGYAQTVTVSWEPANSAVEGYELYLRRANETYDYTQPHYRGPDPFCDLDIEDDATPHYFTVRTYTETQLGDFSTEVPVFSSSPPRGSFNEAKTNLGSQDKPPKQGSFAVLWPNGETEVDLAPVLILSSNHQGLPHSICWQISTESEMANPVLSITKSDQNLTFKVPGMLLDTDTQYYWKAIVQDKDGQILNETKTAPFVTISSQRSNDFNYNGIPDFQELEAASDLDNNGVADSEQADLLCVKAAKGNIILGAISLSPDASLVAVKAYDENSYGHSFNKPEVITYGLLGLKLFLKEGVDKADVKVYFSSPVDPLAKWYKFDSKQGWSVFENAVFSVDRKSVTFSLTDGGIGDEDGVKNGIIVDPSGIGMMSSTNSTNGLTSSSCFIKTVN